MDHRLRGKGDLKSLNEKAEELIQQIDRFHGTQLKDRDKESISEEVSVILLWLLGLEQGS